MRNLSVIILAAGKGTRMKSALPKVLHPVCGLPMLHYPVSVVKRVCSSNSKVVAVVGCGAEDVKAAFGGRGLSFVYQKDQLGTGHAVMQASAALKGVDGDVLILSGDVPLITADTITALVKFHRSGGKAAPVMTLVTAMLANPSGYGRVLRNDAGAVEAVVEEKDCGDCERAIHEINAGIYIVKAGFLFENLKRLGNRNAQSEYYLPDLVRLARKAGHKVKALTHHDTEEVMGINNRVELAKAARVMRQRINTAMMLSGVTIIDPDTTYIDADVSVGVDSIIHPGARIAGATVIGANCVIEQGSHLVDSILGNNTTVKAYSLIEGTKAGKGVIIGPFARLRPGNVIADEARIGNFVEVKKTTIGKGTKANHLSYLGDAVIGAGVNIGAGTITCNYDGAKKHRTVIEDRAFIGSDTQLVAPVKVGKGAYVGSGTTVTKDVPPDALVVTRVSARVVEGWAIKRKKG
ncbi:MAG: bifunctional UDP-N-acetylglucosamine diphosphorylase/glucosamine-1-phosphate N-acetyltransferase GlmU [Deltaproteobacteria bacterium]|nr:bifunctional UDP-N-acetylglucosamine diphosphorylase/glucosamine-1-phosphate N-acetyltransferase GlmU [Deltaproteobacteria bacterium]